jgi:hypothetical protein
LKLQPNNKFIHAFMNIITEHNFDYMFYLSTNNDYFNKTTFYYVVPQKNASDLKDKKYFQSKIIPYTIKSDPWEQNKQIIKNDTIDFETRQKISKLNFLLVGNLGKKLSNPSVFMDLFDYNFFGKCYTVDNFINRNGYINFNISPHIRIEHKSINYQSLVKFIIYNSIRMIEKSSELYNKITKYGSMNKIKINNHLRKLINIRRNILIYKEFIIEQNILFEYLSIIRTDKLRIGIFQIKLIENLIKSINNTVNLINELFDNNIFYNK